MRETAILGLSKSSQESQGHKKRSPVLDYLESPNQDLHESFDCLSQGLTLGSSWHGCEFQLVPSTMDTLLFGLSENEQTQLCCPLY